MQRFVAPGGVLWTVLQAFSAGMLLCLSLVHVGMHAIFELDGLIESGSDPHAGHDHRRRALLASTHTMAAVIDSDEPGLLQVLHDHSTQLLASALQKVGRTLMQDHQHDDHGDGGHGDHGHDDVEGAVIWTYEEHAHDFPVGVCTILFGFVLALAVQEIVSMVVSAVAAASSRATQRQGPDEDDQLPPAAKSVFSNDSNNGVVDTSGDDIEEVRGGKPTDDGSNSVSVAMATNANATPTCRQHAAATGVKSHGDTRDTLQQLSRPTTAAMPGGTVAAHPQQHGSRNDSSSRDGTQALMFELGCVMHSFIIGLSLGVALPRSEALALLIALSFHQLLEGCTLGLLLLHTIGSSTWKVALAIAIYALTCPLGTAVGIGVAYSYDSHSIEARTAQGVVNGVAGGTLLYLAMVVIRMWLPSAHDHGVDGGGNVDEGGAHPHQQQQLSMVARVLGLVAFAAGIAAFAVLALWA